MSRRDHPTIVVGVDGSWQAERALEWAAEDARRRGADLRIVTAVRAPVSPATSAAFTAGNVLDAAREAAQVAVDAAVERASELAPASRVSGEVRAGSAAAVLQQESHYADLLVTGSRGHGSLAGLVLGSVSVAVATSARCPVVVVRPDRRPEHAGDDLTPFSWATAGRVVVGIDGSEGAARALAFAADHAARARLGLTIVSAQPAPAPRSRWLDPSESGTLTTLALDCEAVTRPAAALARMAHPRLDVDVQVVQDGAGGCLVSASHQAALVVLGNRGRPSLTGRLLGSVSRTVLCAAASPVVVVH
ncbi:nucleotide-binding universal stress UspA family protein [Kineococcus xinjiangensis]|uniref:Nucleotide-binding universal stress UspA family protein n=1 Tax=Kineococcus xinjiangensis TaxID=512762 RepID=A0A2S6IJ91_9ACTN|nr:universal stress protein [Kineococcus xinjiangensis]PPK94287.1 nucleotide-binding universal stress UspA family protein [Kineococcus xinjiangensis]